MYLEPGKRILVAPLNWGLGHAARCVPLINELLSMNCKVMLASDGDALAFLQQEFPQLKCFVLPAYDPAYPIGNGMVLKMATQLPKFIKAIKDEQKTIDDIVTKELIDVVISDNRYGAYTKKARSVFMTHQLHLLMPNRWKWMEKTVNDYNRKQLAKFDSIMCPAQNGQAEVFPERLMKDHKNHKAVLMGLLSRFEKMDVPKRYDVAVICSGPEPQRSIFEDMITLELKTVKLKAIVVKGNGWKQNIKYTERNGTTFVNHLGVAELNKVIEESNLIISRSGYTTIMDLAKLGKKAIFIPTPGQTEQEYLARELKEKGIAYSETQQNFNLQKALKETAQYNGFANFEWQENKLRQALESVL